MNPRDMPPREAWTRYVDRRRSDTTMRSVETYHYRIKQFVEWAEREGIERVGDLDGWDLERYATARQNDGLAAVTIKGEFQTVKNWLEYLERIEAVDEGLAERLDVPNIDVSEESSDKKLPTEQAMALIGHYRDTEFGSRRHVLLELLWHTGARLGAIRGLDLEDYEDGVVWFVHRPKSETPLKNKSDGERPVALPDVVGRAIETYLNKPSPERWDKRDDYGRIPLLTSRQGRLGINTVRVLTYKATIPCHYRDCPHDKDKHTCEWVNRKRSSRCPSSRSPHQVRTGSITWQLDQGLPPEVVAERANASVKIIKRHYDKASPLQKMEQRRQQYIDNLDFDLGP